VFTLQPIYRSPPTPEVQRGALPAPAPALTSWAVPGGRATGPWLDRPSGVIGPPTEVLALVIGDTGPGGSLPGARFERIDRVATHSLVRLSVRGSPVRALSALASRGHPVAGRDFATRRFFAEKAGLVRDFTHISGAGSVAAPLHGDLALALTALRERDPVSSPGLRPGRRRRNRR
jgi:hypothetical protein